MDPQISNSNRQNYNNLKSAIIKDNSCPRRYGMVIFPIEYGLNTIFIFGDMYLNNLKENKTKTMFWLHYILAIGDLIVKRQPFNFIKECAMPIWYNFQICRSRSQISL